MGAALLTQPDKIKEVLCVCVRACVHACMYGCVCVYTALTVCFIICVYACIHTYIHTNVYVCSMYIYTHACTNNETYIQYSMTL